MANTKLEQWKKKYGTQGSTQTTHYEKKSEGQNDNSAPLSKETALEKWKEKYSVLENNVSSTTPTKPTTATKPTSKTTTNQATTYEERKKEIESEIAKITREMAISAPATSYSRSPTFEKLLSRREELFNELKTIEAQITETEPFVFKADMSKIWGKENDDIVPVAQAPGIIKGKIKEDLLNKHLAEKNRTWFDKGVFKDGYQFGDLTKGILGTGTDATTHIGAGIMGLGEKLADAAAILGNAQYQQNMAEQMAYDAIAIRLSGGEQPELVKQFAEMKTESDKSTAEFVAKDLYDEEGIAKKIISDPVKKVTGVDSETDSFLGEKSDDLAVSGGQYLGQIGINAALPGSGMVVMGLTSFSSEVENALNNGATYDEAVLSGANTAIAEMLTERIAGVSFGGKTLTDVAFEKLSSKMTSKFLKYLITSAKLAVDAGGGGLEEVVSGYITALGQKLTYMEDEEIEELFSNEDVWESFVGGLVLEGTFSVGKSVITGHNAVNGMTKNEQAVIDEGKTNPNATDNSISRVKTEADNAVQMAVESEAQTASEPDTLEKAAMDVVESRNDVQAENEQHQQGESIAANDTNTTEGIKMPENDVEGQTAEVTLENMENITDGKAEGVADTDRSSQGKTTAETLDELSGNNIPITVAEVKEVTGFGDSGSVLIAELANADGVTFSQAKNTVETAYLAGFTGLDESKATFATDTQRLAFRAGSQDRRVQNNANAEKAQSASVYENGFTENEYSEKLSPTTLESAADVSKTPARRKVEEEFEHLKEVRGLGVSTDYDKMLSQLENRNFATAETHFGETYHIQKKSNGKYVAIVEGEGSGGFVPSELNKECDTFDEAYMSCWEYIYNRNPVLYGIENVDGIGQNVATNVAEGTRVSVADVNGQGVSSDINRTESDKYIAKDKVLTEKAESGTIEANSTETEDNINVRGEETISDTSNAESRREKGEDVPRETGSTRQSVSRKIKEILRKSSIKTSDNGLDGNGTARIEQTETAEAFEERALNDGYMYVNFGKSTIAYKYSLKSEWNENAKEAAENLENLGLTVVVYEGELRTNNRGVSEILTEGATVGRGDNLTIFISSKLDIDGMETAYHEAFHALRRNGNKNNVKHHYKMIDIISDGVNTESEAFEKFVSAIGELYSYEVKNVSIDRFSEEITEEFYAWYVGTINAKKNEHSMDMLEYIKEFSDSDTIKAQIDAVFAEIKSDVSSVTENDTYNSGGSVQESILVSEGKKNSAEEVSDGQDTERVQKKANSSDVDTFQKNEDTDKLAMWTTKRVGEEVKPKSISEIVAYIEHEFGINITTGHIRDGDVQGTYTPDNHGIKTKIANNLPVISHELGHYFERTLGIKSQLTEELTEELISRLDKSFAQNYTPEKLIREGVAEYVRRFLLNRETASIDYPLFTDFFLKQFSGKDLAKLEQLADDINAYYSLDADTATSSIRLREEGSIDLRTPMEKLKDSGNALYQAWYDINDSIKRFDRATGSNAHMFATNAAYSDAIAGQIITGDLTDKNGQYVSSGLKTVLHGIDLNNKDEYRLFGEYLTVKHGPERLREGMRVFADDRKNSTVFMERRQSELESQYPQFKEASERLYTFIKQFYRAWGVETGLISEAMLDGWEKRWEYYVPFNRVMEKGKGNIGAKRGFANQNSTIKKAHGSGRDIQHPVDNVIDNIVRMVNAGTRNNVMAVIYKAVKQLGADATFLEEVPMPMTATQMDMTGVKDTLTTWLEESNMDSDSKDTASGIVNRLDNILIQYGRGKAFGNVVTVLIDGQPKALKINDVGLLESLTNLSPKTMDGLLDAIAIASRFVASNVTGNNLVWSIFSNLPRDFGTFFTYSKNKNIAKMAVGVGGAYLNKAKGDNADPLYKEFLAMGGGKTSAYTADRDLTKNLRKKLSGKKFDPNPLNWIGFTSDTIESGPRFATYKLMREAGMTPQEAFYEAMDITVNFRRGGRISREINKFVPFFNATMQGLDKFRRWITADELAGKPERKKVIRNRMPAYIATSIALAATFYAINNGDEEKEKEYEQLSTYTKNSFWVFPIGDGKYFAIPKPREIGVLSSFFETCLEYGVGKNDHAFDEFYSYATENFLPAIASDIAQIPTKGVLEASMSAIGSLVMVGPLANLGANRDFLGRPIVASGLQNLEPKDQYTDRTSKIAYWLGQATGGSPEQIDYFFQQVFGGWWKYQKALFPVGEKNRDLSLGVYNTYVKDNQYSTDLTNWLYDRADITARAKKSNPTDIQKSITAKWDSNMTDFYGTYYKKAKNTDTTATRSTRQLVLDMIKEYQKGIDGNYKTSLQEAVEAVCTSKNSTEYLPSVMSGEVTDGNDEKHNLSDVQYVEYQTDYLRLYWEIVEDTMTNNMSVEKKAQILLSAKRVAKERATERTLNRIGAPTSEFAIKYKDIENDDLTGFLAGVSEANQDDSLTKSEVVDVIKDLNVDDVDTWTLFLSRYDGTGVQYAYDNGIGGNTYIDFLEALDEVDKPTESGKYGTYTQDEATAAIKNLKGLSREEKAVLWQSVNTKWKKNPFK